MQPEKAVDSLFDWFLKEAVHSTPPKWGVAVILGFKEWFAL